MHSERTNKDRGARSSGRTARLAVAVLVAAALGPGARAEEAKAAGSGAGGGLESPQVSLGGQYRINTYSAENDYPGQDSQTASRVRVRQNVDLRFDDRFRTHVQLELGHTTSNVGTTDTRIGVRHAVLDYTSERRVNVQAGIVPLGDRFGDLLFSSDWNYNPVALALTAPLGPVTIRAFAGTLLESKADGATVTGGEEVSADDTTHYQLDVGLALGERVRLDAGGTFVQFSPDKIAPFRSRNHVNYGLGARVNVARDLAVHAAVLGSRTESPIIAGNGDARGVAAKLELTGKLGPVKFGLLGTHATGKDDGTGFLPVQAVATTNGYWGYTGILTVQGPTDTGFDGDSVNVSNNGYGMTTAQVKLTAPVYGDLGAYAAAGWFGNSGGVGRSGDVGTDFLLMATYRFNRVLALDVGGGYARIEDSASGYEAGPSGGFRQAAGTSRTKTAVVARVQAEF